MSIRHLIHCHTTDTALFGVSMQKLAEITQKIVFGIKTGTHVIAEASTYWRKKMSEETNWKEELIEKYPDLFGTTYPCVSDGWSHLLQALCLQINHYLKYTNKTIVADDYDLYLDNDSMYKFSFSQIKEKFGGLRAYFNGGDDFISGVITFAETMSYEICETCGGKGKLRRTAWNSTLCDEHYEERVIFDNAKKQEFNEQQLDMWDKTEGLSNEDYN